MLNAAVSPAAVKAAFKKPGIYKGSNPRLPGATRRSRQMRGEAFFPLGYPCEFLAVWRPLVHSTLVRVRF